MIVKWRIRAFALVALLLLGDGGGAAAQNIAGSATGLVRMKPFDPAHSFLLIKLSTTARADPAFGHGMPFPAPGSVCPATLQAIADWIDAGASW